MSDPERSWAEEVHRDVADCPVSPAVTQLKNLHISKRHLARSKRMMVSTVVASLVVGTFELLAGSDFERLGRVDAATLAWTLPVVGFLALASWVATRIVLRQLRQLRLRVSREGLALEGNRVRRELAWSEVTKVRIRLGSDNEPRVIELFSTATPPILLNGFEAMSDLVRLVGASVPPRTEVQNRRLSFPQESLLAIVGAALVGTLILDAVRLLGTAVFPYTAAVACTGFVGIFLLAFRPVSRAIPHLRRWEFIGGLLLVVYAAALLLASGLSVVDIIVRLIRT